VGAIPTYWGMLMVAENSAGILTGSPISGSAALAPQQSADPCVERKPRATFRPDIQGLRAVAVVAVVINHLTHQPIGGFVGVDVFFVISGYLITGLLLREHDRTGGISYRGFYVRRIKRIIPAAVLVLAATDAGSFFLTPGIRFRATVADSWWSLMFAANWHFGLNGTDYFQQGQLPSPLQHYWSLAVEEQFYFIWPWLMLGLLLVGAHHYGWTQDQRRVPVGVAIGIISIASFAYALHSTSVDTNWAYFSSFARAWELGVGALVAIAAAKLHLRSNRLRTCLGWVGLIGVVASLFAVDPAHGFPAPAAALPVGFAALVIVAGEGDAQRFLWPLTNPISQYIGNISYSLYLWHFPVVMLLLAVLPIGAAYYVSATALMILLSVASFHLVENPVRRSAWLVGDRRRRRRWQAFRWSTLGLVVVLVVTACLVVAVFARNGDTSGGTVAQTALAAPVQTVAKPMCLGAASITRTKSCDPSLGTQVYPNPAELANDVGASYDCFSQINKPMLTCSYGSSRKDATSVALLGDSHALALLPGLEEEASSKNWRLDTYIGAGCVWGKAHDCNAAMPQIQQRLQNGPRYDMVITTAYRGSTGGGDAVAKAFADVWKPVATRGTTIIAVADVPIVTTSAMECVTRLNFSVQSHCATPLNEAFRVDDPLPRAVKLVPGAKFVDLRKYFCNDTECPTVIGNVIVYRDTISHLTGTYSKTLGPYLADALSAAMAH
jgi:peptidoglycan/LPS O-acetylase OafA/YrhL